MERVNSVAKITKIVLPKDFPKNLLQIAPTPMAVNEKPPIITATTLAIGIKTITGIKRAASAFSANKEDNSNTITADKTHLIYNLKST